MTAVVRYRRPATLDEALVLLADLGPRATILAGGQDVVPLMNLGRLQPADLIDISALDDLRGIAQDDRGVTIGALVTHREILSMSAAIPSLALLAAAAAQIGGGMQVCNRGTIGGAVCVGEPAYDYPACLVVLDAQCRLVSKAGERLVPASAFFRGARDVDRRPDELLASIVVPALMPGTEAAYRKLKFTDGCYGIVTAACSVALASDGSVEAVRLAVGGATAAPVRLGSVEAMLTGAHLTDGRLTDGALAEAARRAEQAIEEPLTDAMAHGDYRRAMAGVMVRRVLADALARTQATASGYRTAESAQTRSRVRNTVKLQGGNREPRGPAAGERAPAGALVPDEWVPGMLVRDDLVPVRVVVNGKPRRADVDPRAPLVHMLRDALDLTGTRFGCLAGHCGACTVLLNGRAVKSCTVLAASADGAEILTIEGVAEGERLHPVQQAFWDHFGFQCGYCTPGMILTALELLDDQPHPTEEDIRAGLAGNLCRCTGYQGIITAVRAAADAASGGMA